MMMIQTLANATYSMKATDSLSLSSGTYYKFTIDIKTIFSGDTSSQTEKFGAEFGLTGIDENIKEMNLDCVVSDGEYTITDVTNNIEYGGTYKVMEENKDSVIYSLISEEGTGMAVTSITKGDDGSRTPTLIISMGGYDLNFQSEELE